MRNCKIFSSQVAASLVIAALLVSCSGKAVIDCTVKDAPETEVIVKQLDINKYEVLDTVKTNSSGHFTYKMNIRPGQPEFVYLFHGDTKIASLLLQNRERAVVQADTLGAYTVEGSPESARLREVEQDLADFSVRFIGLSDRLDACDPDSDEALAIRKEMTSEYVSYYRSRLKYVMSNPYSLTVVPVFFQMVAPNFPVFSQQTDAIHFRTICDSLQTVYPDSRYVAALRDEADRRLEIMELNNRLENASQVDYLEIEMPDVNGVKRRLSETEAKVTLLHFWTATDAAQKMFNLEVLLPVYKEYKDRGFEIYQVAIDTDKASWARVVKEQGLDWINVCDGLGTASPVISTYNLSALPVSFIISDGELSGERISDEASLRRTLNRLLK